MIAKPKLRWCQFSLRTLLFVMTLAGGSLGWIGNFRYCMSRANTHEFEENAYELADRMSVRSFNSRDDQLGTENNSEYFLRHAEKHGRLKDAYRHAAWCPWLRPKFVLTTLEQEP